MSIQRRAVLAAATTAGLVGLSGCIIGPERRGSALGTLRIASTTSVEDSGLIAELNVAFEARFETSVQTLPRGTGAALRLVADGDVDAGIAHAPRLEVPLIDAGDAVNRRAMMWNRFTVVGPTDDPVGLEGVTTLTEAFELLAAGEAVFLSRGDESGTHAREQEIWEALGFEPAGRWYQSVGQGMGETLVQADQRGAYTLTDEGTLRSMRENLNVERLVEAAADDPLHINRYSILASNPYRHEGVAHDLALAYIGFVVGDEGQAVINEFRTGGEQLFQPTETLPEAADA